jgi:hypothetical protein
VPSATSPTGRATTAKGLSRMRANSHVRLCVQRRLACSAGGKSARVKARRSVAWRAEGRATHLLKPLDNTICGMVASHQAVAQANAQVAPKRKSPGGRACNRNGEGSMGSRRLADTAGPLRRGGSDGRATRIRQATGEALRVPLGKRWSKVGCRTGSSGKAAEDARAAEGFVVARKWGNANRAKGPCCSTFL